MAERRDRTPEEREAARLERQRRRSGTYNQPEYERPPDQFVDWASYAEPPPAAGPDGRDGELPVHEPVSPEVSVSPVQPPIDHPQPAPEPVVPAGPETEEYSIEHEEPEVPSGTRRVSRAEGAASAAASASAPRARRRQPVRRQPRGIRPAGRRERSWAGRVVALIAIVLAAAIIWFVVELFQLLGTSPHGRVTVLIPARSSADQIATLLARDQVISSTFFFKLRATLAGERGDLRSGTYHLQQGMSYGSVLTALTRIPPAAPTTQLTLAEGHTRQYVASLLRRQGIRGNYLAATRSSPLLNPHSYGAPRHVPSLEGFLFPDTFSLVKPVKASALVDDQLRDFKQRFAGVSLSYARSKHLTAYDVLKIASLVQAEAASPHDFALVASVIYNRLADNMMLQLDSTARYATGNFTKPLKVSQLHSSSPYNTHTHFGLPPTPINSPGIAAIQAAANPARSRYLYFFSLPCTTRSAFATSYNQFLHLLAVDKRTHC